MTMGNYNTGSTWFNNSLGLLSKKALSINGESHKNEGTTCTDSKKDSERKPENNGGKHK